MSGCANNDLKPPYTNTGLRFFNGIYKIKLLSFLYNRYIHVLSNGMETNLKVMITNGLRGSNPFGYNYSASYSS